MSRLILTVGISNSGKSYWAEQFCEDNPEYINLNRDDIRARDYTYSGEVQDYKFTKQKEKDVTITQERLADFAMIKGKNIIISDTNLNPKTRLKWQEWAKLNGYEYEEKVFNVEPHICIKRSLKRDYTVPPHIINKQYVQMREYLGFEPYRHDPKISRKAIIYDMDGTLACMEGIRKPFDWKECINDKPRWTVINMLNKYSEDYDIVIMSGRDSICRPETEQWLKAYGVKYDYLFMRKEGDERSDPIIKEELFNEYVKPHVNVIFVVDDRQRMVDHWRNMGVECWQVQSGDF